MRDPRGMAAALCLFVALLAPHACGAKEIRLDDARRRAIVEEASALVTANYVYLDRAKAVETTLRERVRKGGYHSDTGLDAFLDHLNRDMQTAGNDKHLRVGCDPKVVAQLRMDAADDGKVDPQYVRMLEQNNYRLKRVESLEGNVGYFKLDNFVELRFAKEALAGAMNFVRHSSALILDLTDNGGGAAEAADFLVSYFLPEGTRIGETWNRAAGETKEETVTRAPDVAPMLETPLVILVGPRTASAAEAVAYTLQQAKRAIVVGSRTKGMANSGNLFAIDDSFFVMVPTIVHKNAITGTNWEGTGVVPDVAVAPEKAMAAGIAAALERAAARSDDPREAFRLRFFARPYAARVSPEEPPPGFLDACVGEYEGGQRIVMKDGTLHYLKGDTDRVMTYMADRTFTVDGRTDYRIRFESEGDRLSALRVLWYDDTSDRYRKVK